ncbi:amidohydrolase family protein [Vibrio lentus]|nr:amidohydrolase family protein [Vibrio lentus]
MVFLANGTDEVLAAAATAFIKAPHKSKMAVTGGVSSTTDPLYVNEYTLEEIEAAVIASDYEGTHVMVHAHSSGIQRAIKAGVKTIEHAAMADEETFAMIANRALYFDSSVGI